MSEEPLGGLWRSGFRYPHCGRAQDQMPTPPARADHCALSQVSRHYGRRCGGNSFSMGIELPFACTIRT